LSHNLKNRIEKIQELIDRLVLESQKGILLVVEGKKDINSLRELCVEGPIILAKNSGKSLTDLCLYIEEKAFREVILLLDFDRKGVEMTKKLKQRLENVGIKPNLYYWEELKSLTGRELKDVEGLATYIKNLKRKCEIRKL
jgi:2,5-diamino-6-(ribosylamino)-4(3H)-pyrimidinone 5'-phosphate reductase